MNMGSELRGSGTLVGAPASSTEPQAAARQQAFAQTRGGAPCVPLCALWKSSGFAVVQPSAPETCSKMAIE